MQDLKDREDVRQIISQSVDSVLSNALDNIVDDTVEGIYAGLIVDNNDPEKLGRCKIRIYNLFDGQVPDSYLPWAIPNFEFIGSKLGSFIVPPVGAIVMVYFDQGDIYLPHYTTKAINRNQLSKLRLENYPDTMVFFETDEGDYFTINRKTRMVKFHHSSGNEIKLEKNGNTTIDIKNNLTQNISGKDNLNVTGDKTEIVTGTNTLKNKTSTGQIKIDNLGNITISGLNVTIEHTLTTTVKGSAVIPTGSGPLNTLPTDPITGLPHAGTVCVG